MKTVLLLSLLLPLPTFAEDGGTVENGGDTVVCYDFEKPMPAPRPIKGPFVPDGAHRYSVDYIRALTAGHKKEDFFGPSSWEHSRDRIRALVSLAYPEWADHFAKYSDSTSQIDLSPEEDEDKPRAGSEIQRRWFKWDSFLNIGGPMADFPRQCMFYMEKNGIVMWTVIFQRSILRTQLSPIAVAYQYNKESLVEISSNSPLQLSFMLVHEWLWDFTQDPITNQRLNIFLHSHEASRLSPSELRQRLIMLGMQRPNYN